MPFVALEVFLSSYLTIQLCTTH